MKPSVFIGSSTEGLAIANALHSNLTFDAECTVWKNGVFQPSASTLSGLLDILDISDFGIFVFSPDDVLMMRDLENRVVRDNVLFELGLFIGRLSPERCFFLIPDSKPMHLPTDLHGVAPIRYESNRRDANWEAGLNPACSKIRKVVRALAAKTELRPLDASKLANEIPRVAPNIQESDVIATSHKVIIEAYKKGFLIRATTDEAVARVKSLPYASFNKFLSGWIIPQSKVEVARIDLAIYL